MAAIDEADELKILELTNERNRLAHELRHLIGGSQTHDFEALFSDVTELVAKIDRWWVINVEIATDPDMMDKEIEEAGVQPGSVIMLQMLSQTALGEDDRAWAYYKAFMVESGKSAESPAQG